MKGHQYTIVALVLACALLLSGCTSTVDTDLSQLKKTSVLYNAIQSTGVLEPSNADIEGFTKALENKYIALYYSEDTAAVRVFDKRNGSVWDSNPIEKGLSNSAMSQITLSTISAKGVIKDYTSYSDSLLKNQVTFECSSDLTVTYTFGNVKPDLSGVPSRLTDERFAELQKRVEEADGNKKLLERRYTQNDDGIWVRKINLTTDQSKKLRELFESINYTEKELANDIASAGGEAEEESTGFSIPLKYSLEEDSLLVSISGEDMVYPTAEIITSLNILGYFGAMQAEQEGYLFVPNGSGALVDTMPKSGDDGAYSLTVYGTDYTIPVERESGQDAQNLMPVFGISREKDGVFAIIEDNDAVASINISKSGDVDKFNTINASFAINTAENIGLSSDSVSKFYVTSKSHYNGNTAIRYIFLGEKYYTYSGMAAIYRDYLTSTQKRDKLNDKGDIPLFLETVGAVESETSTLGFVHKKDVALTSFSDDISILSDMSNAGVSDVRLILSGWMNGGENQEIADGVDVMSVLGGNKGLKKLLSFADKSGYAVYPKVLLNTFSNNDSIITKNLYSSKTLGSEKSLYYTYDKLTGNALSDGSERYLLSPAKQQKISAELLKSLNKKSVNSLLIDDLASTVYSDYSKNSEVLRQTSLLQSEKIISNYAEEKQDIMLTAPNVTTAYHSTVYTDVPVSSGSYKVLKCSVPFYQMVYHGYAQYSSSALNFTADFRTNLLKCAEYGASPKFRFVFDAGVDLSPAEQTQYYAASYSRWKDTMVKAYDELNQLLSDVKNAEMRTHQELFSGVYRTDYDNGISIYVNYNDTSVTVDEVEIPALSAKSKEGEH